MAVETPVPLDYPPHKVFASAQEALDEYRANPAPFIHHLHAAYTPEHAVAVENLRRRLLRIPSSQVEISKRLTPRGPHIEFEYFSGYFPGAVRAFVINILLSSRVPPCMMHPLTGFQYAEHQLPLAKFYGRGAFPANAIDWEALKGYDKDANRNSLIPV